jgi:4-hydroxybenzoate polyprenyltransferase
MIKRLLTAVCDLDQLLRLHQLGFVAIWPLLGLAAVSDWSPLAVAGLLTVSLFFNTFGVLLDDAVHLDVDRRDPLRSNRWLVRGSVTQRQAVVAAIAQVPLMVAVHFAAGFTIAALPCLLGAVVGQGLYDLYGKKCRVPPLMEAAEAAAAFLLVVYGATATGNATNSLVWLTAGAGAAFILLVNAFHGSLRDIAFEIACDQRTTPIWLGCRGIQEGVVHISSAMSAYAGAWQVVLIALSIAVIAQPGSTADRNLLVVLAAGIVALANAALFVLLHRVRKPAWDVVMRGHVTILALPIMLAFAPRLGPSRTGLLFVVYFAPTLLTAHYWFNRTRGSMAGSRATSATDVHMPLPEQDLTPGLAGNDLDFRRLINEHRRPSDRQPQAARLNRQA